MTLRAAAFGQVGRLVVVSVYQNRNSVPPMCMKSGGLLKAQRPKQMEEPVPANHFVLEHDHKIHVEYTAGVIPGIPALTYRDGNSPRWNSRAVRSRRTKRRSERSSPFLSRDQSTRAARGSGSSCPSSTFRAGNPGTSKRWACTNGSAGLTRSRGGRRHGGVSSSAEPPRP